MLVVNLEHRVFSQFNVWFLKLGTSYFFDSGVVWGQGEGFGGQRFHSDAGIGIQVESGKNLGNSVFRVDLAYNMDRRGVCPPDTRRRAGTAFALKQALKRQKPLPILPAGVFVLRELDVRLEIERQALLQFLPVCLVPLIFLFAAWAAV